MRRRKWTRFFAAALSCAMLSACAEPVAEQTEPSTEPTVPVEETQPASVGLELPKGYRDAVAYGEGFLVVGTEGRIDYISDDGVVEARQAGTDADLTCITLDGDFIIISADDGTVLSSDDGVNYTVDTVGSEPLLGVTVFGDRAFAVSDRGTIYSSVDLVEWESTHVDGLDSAVGIASDEMCVVVVSEASDIVTSADGMNWDYQNYNEKYDGLAEAFGFRRVIGAGGTFFILGYYLKNPNIPTVLYSETGEVLMEKALLEINGEAPTGETPIVPNDLGVDIDQLYAPCEDGSVLTLTSCVVCNELQQLDGAPALNTIALTEKSVLLAGDDYFFTIVDHDVLRQDRIKAEQAKYDIENRGAVLVDVREDEELEADGYIQGSLHIPLAEVAEKLPELVPNLETELIFYCAAGKRAGQAAETAADMGYYMVYNLGGLSDWPYEDEIVQGTNP